MNGSSRTRGYTIRSRDSHARAMHRAASCFDRVRAVAARVWLASMRGSVLRVLLFLVALAHGAPGMAAAGDHNRRFGKTLLVEHKLPDAAVRKFNTFKPSAPTPGESKLIDTMLADTEDWAGPEIDGRTTGNPYTIAILLKARARADGDATSLWQAGWRIESKFGGDEMRMMPLAGLAKTGAKAGESLELAAAAIPTSFKEDRKAAPAIGLVNTRNLEITEVRVQVWSGQAETTFAETVLSFRWALVGLVLIALWWFGFRRR